MGGFDKDEFLERAREVLVEMIDKGCYGSVTFTFQAGIPRRYYDQEVIIGDGITVAVTRGKDE